MAEQNVTSPDNSTVAATNSSYAEVGAENAGFFEQNKNAVYGGILVLLLVVFGLYFFVFRNNGADKIASEEMFQAQFLFEQDSFRTALNGKDIAGQERVFGFLDIIENHKGSASANLAHYYAGVCLLQLGEFEQAITYLEQYSGKDALTQAFAYGAIGDAKSELNKMDEALTFYKKASEYKPNMASTPYFLRKTGRLLEHQGKKEEAAAYYTRVQKEYSEYGERIAIDKDIIRVTGTYE